MKPQEVLETLVAMGVEVSLPTLQRYARQGLIKRPDVTSLGRGMGKHSEHDLDAVFEAYAAAKLLGKPLYPVPVPPVQIGDKTLTVPTRKVTVRDVVAARRLVLSLPENHRRRGAPVPITITHNTTDEEFFTGLIAKRWLELYAEAQGVFNTALDEEVAKLRERREKLRRRYVDDIETMARDT